MSIKLNNQFIYKPNNKIIEWSEVQNPDEWECPCLFVKRDDDGDLICDHCGETVA